MKSTFDWRFSFSAMVFRIMARSNFRSGKFHAYGQYTVKPENLRQAPSVSIKNFSELATEK
ncbi:hypothetical protein AGR4B_pAt20248 [Agrobacterium tumefaciens str. CFBP 5621]|nr:hypothetical protein AGR4B_pAt20248 [Agrobacterium tumefaciens str. CFBP 5621]